MLEIGHEFERKGKKYCVIDIIELDLKKYVLFSIEEKDENINYKFFKITENMSGYNLEEVIDDNIINQLFDKIERSGNERQ